MKYKKRILSCLLLSILVLSNVPTQAEEAATSTTSSEPNATIATMDSSSLISDVASSSTDTSLTEPSSSSAPQTDSSLTSATSEAVDSSTTDPSSNSSSEAVATTGASDTQSAISDDRSAREVNNTDGDGDAVTPATVFGRDDRVLVKNPLITPYKQNVYVVARFKDAGTSSGSGVMIAPNKVLTAAHCVRRVDTNEWAESVTVYPAYLGGYAPYGSATGTTYHVLTSFKNDLTSGKYGYGQNKLENDIAVITLSQSLPEIGYLSVTDKVAVNQRAQVVGYPGEKGMHMYAASGPILEVSDRILRYQIDMTPGNSGGPVLDANNKIIAINVAENTTRN